MPVVAYAPRTKEEAAQWLPILSTIMSGTHTRFVLTSDKVAKHMKSCSKDWASSSKQGVGCFEMAWRWQGVGCSEMAGGWVLGVDSLFTCCNGLL